MIKVVKVAILVLVLFFLGGCGGEQLFTITDMKKPEVQMQVAEAYIDGYIQKLKDIKKVAIAEFTVCYLKSYEDTAGYSGMSMQLEFNDATYQSGANILKDIFIKKLNAAGYQVVPEVTVFADKNFQELAGNPAEDFITYHHVNNKTMKYRFIPATGYKVTGGGTGFFGSGIAANALAQAGNKGRYPRISRDVGADATLVVHLMVGHDKGDNMMIVKSDSWPLMNIYYGVNDDGHNNIFAQEELAINLKKPFKLDMNTLPKNIEADYGWFGKVTTVSFRDYIGRIGILWESLLDAAIAKAKS